MRIVEGHGPEIQMQGNGFNDLVMAVRERELAKSFLCIRLFPYALHPV